MPEAARGQVRKNQDQDQQKYIGLSAPAGPGGASPVQTLRWVLFSDLRGVTGYAPYYEGFLTREFEASPALQNHALMMRKLRLATERQMRVVCKRLRHGDTAVARHPVGVMQGCYKDALRNVRMLVRVCVCVCVLCACVCVCM